MYEQLALAALSFGAGALAQQVGTLTAETHPAMPWQLCTDAGCEDQAGTISLDANWRWVHEAGSSTNCYTGDTWDASLCPDDATCAQNCALDGADYEGTYGVVASGGSLDLTLVTGSNAGSRVYMMASEDKYEMFKLKNKEFTFDVDVSNLPCGLNGALYFVSMDADGGMSRFPDNTAGAKYGTGYCDAQCPQDIKFINGQANVDGWEPSGNNPNTGTGSHGSCCAEMDVWEANSVSTAFTPHVCTKAGQTMCTTDEECGAGDGNRNAGTCDKDGCDFNSYRMGNESFYGEGQIVDTTSKFTVVTKFITADGTDTGKLSSIQRLYIQDGKVIQNSVSDIAGVDATNEMTDEFCEQQKTAFGDADSFLSRGGLESMGDDFDTGMVLVMSIWDDYAAQMLWLDAPYPPDAALTEPGVVRGTCPADSGVPSEVEAESPGSSVTFSNIKFGALGSTYAA